jgi:Fic family protein
MFQKDAPGELVIIRGSDPVSGSWEHRAYIPETLPDGMPDLAPQTYLVVAEARAAIAALDNTARQLPNPTLLRAPTLRREAQSTSALEGTYAPLEAVLTADEDDPGTADMVEILNYVRMAQHGFGWVADGRPISSTFLADLQGLLMRGTPLERESGRLRETQVVIGRRAGADLDAAPIHQARFVPAPPGHELEDGVRALVAWLRTDHRGVIDPVIAAAMAHYQFETLHPFRDGNGRVGRFLIVLHLLSSGILSEPTLTVSPWFEARRADYYDRLLGVSTDGDWDAFVRFFSTGIREAADNTHAEMVALVNVQAELKDTVRASSLRAESALNVVDMAVGNPTFSVRTAADELGLSYGRANKLVGQLVDLGVLAVVDPNAYKRRFFAPRVLSVLTGSVR